MVYFLSLVMFGLWLKGWIKIKYVFNLSVVLLYLYIKTLGFRQNVTQIRAKVLTF